MAEFDPLGPDRPEEPPTLIDLLDVDEEEPEIFVTMVSSSRGFVPTSSTTTMVPEIDIKHLLDQIQRLETRVQNQSNLLLEQAANYRLMEECMKLMKENMDERLEELEKRIDRVEAVAVAGAQSASSCRAPPPQFLTSTSLPTRTTTTVPQQQLHPNTAGRAIPGRIPGQPGLARRTTGTTRATEMHNQSIPQGILSRTTTTNSSNKHHEHNNIVVENVKLELEEVQNLLPTSRRKTRDVNPFQCKFCPPTSVLIFQDAEGLANHYTSRHSIPGVGKNRVLASASAIDKPQRTGMTHTLQGRAQPKSRSPAWVNKNQKRSGTCRQCGKYVVNIYQHRETHKSPSERHHFICTVCGADFVTKRSLHKHHRNRHTNEPIPRPLPTFPCQICGKLFRGKQALKGHMNAHTGKRPYPCKYCGKTFSRPQALWAHSFIHTGNHPYACEQCGLKFVDRCRFVSHKLRCHGKKTISRASGECQSESQDPFPRIQTSSKIEIIETFETTFDNAENTD